jgi:hypothetical protein
MTRRRPGAGMATLVIIFFAKSLAGDNSPGLSQTQKRSDTDMSPRTPTVAKGTSKLGTRLAEPQDLNKNYETNSPGLPPRIEKNSFGSVYQNSPKQ